MSLSKEQACNLLGISPSTLQRRIAKGTYSCTREAGQYGALSFTYADLNLPEPEVVEPEPALRISARPEHTAPVAVAPAKPSLPSPELTDDEKFARDYLAGVRPDSLGNFFNSTDTTTLIAAPAPLQPSEESNFDPRFVPISYRQWDGTIVSAMAHRSTRGQAKKDVSCGWGGNSTYGKE